MASLPRTGVTIGPAAPHVKRACTPRAVAPIDGSGVGWHCPAWEYGASPSETPARGWREGSRNRSLIRTVLRTADQHRQESLGMSQPRLTSRQARMSAASAALAAVGTPA